MESAETRLTSPQTLPAGWIERIFARLGACYGNKFSEMWKGQDMASVLEIWASELARYTVPELQYGLSSLRRQHPAWPPTLYEFCELCRASPSQNVPALPVPPRTSEEAAQLTKLHAAIKNAKRPHALAWAEKILQRHADGDRTLEPIALKMARDAPRIAAGGAPRS